MVQINDFADYLISLGMCPNIDFLYKLIGLTLKKPIAEIKCIGILKLEEFVKLFASTHKSELLLKVLDTEAKRLQVLEETPTKRQIENICGEVFVYIKSLVTLHSKKLQSLSKISNSIINKNMSIVLKKVSDLHSEEYCNIINSYSINIANNPKLSLKVDNLIKKLIIREYKKCKRNEISSFPFPYASILDHYVAI